MGLQVLQALHQLLGGVQAPKQLSAKQGIPNSRTFAPQLPSQGQDIQSAPGRQQLQGQPEPAYGNPQYQNGYSLLNMNLIQPQSIQSLVNSYNQDHYVPPQNRNYDVANYYGYHNLSSQQHAAGPFDGGLIGHVTIPGQGIAMKAFHSLVGK